MPTSSERETRPGTDSWRLSESPARVLLNSLWRSCQSVPSPILTISSCSTMPGREKRPGRPASIPPIKPSRWPGAATIRSFWNESMAFCEMFLPELGSHSPEMETMYYKAVTGKNDSFADTMRTGQKIWTLERAIRVMHGRSRAEGRLLSIHVYAGGIRHCHLRRGAHL